MTFTGLTPLLDSYRAAGKVLFDVPYAAGQYLDRAGLYAPAVAADLILNRKGATAAGISTIIRITYAGFAVPQRAVTILCDITRGSDNLSGPQMAYDAKLYFGLSTTGRFILGSNGTATTANSANNIFLPGERKILAATRNNATPSLGNLYANGVLTGGANQSTGDITAPGEDFKVLRSPRSCIIHRLVIIDEEMSAANVLTLSNELKNEISYETNNLIINSTYPTIGTSVWEARYGLLAGEKTMSAGQSLGQLDPLKVSTGTHKATTFLYNGVLAKGIKCVTAGNIILPDTVPDKGTTWVYRYYDDSAGTWATRTSASSTVALDAVNDIILWCDINSQNFMYKY